MQPYSLDPTLINNLQNLDIQARLLVEGFISGLHKSPFHGFSVEFSQYRPYQTGDDLRFVDWKVLGRTDRYYIKQFEQETNLRAHILLDFSRSMFFGREGRPNKYTYAGVLASALAYLLIKQKDAVGLGIFDSRIRKLLPPKSVPSYLPQIYSTIRQATGGTDTGIAPVLHELAEKIPRRGLLIVLSDLLDDPEEILKGLRHFRHNGHEVLLFQILDPSELKLDFDGEVLFKDMENNQQVKTIPRYIREVYRQQVREFQDFYRMQCSRQQIDYSLFTTDTDISRALFQFLMKRKRMY